MCSQQRRVARLILKHLVDAHFPSMFVGGCVRDSLMGVEPHDYDIASVALPEQVQNIFSLLIDFDCIATGIDHGTVTVVSQGCSVEVTTLRRDIQTDGRHAVVEFGDDFEQDALRRDFTMNALYEDIDGRIHDYVGGQDDLKLRCIRFVGDPATRLEEDVLRALRYFRFKSRFDLRAERDVDEMVCRFLPRVAFLSRERIHSEWIRMLGCAHLSYEQIEQWSALRLWRMIWLSQTSGVSLEDGELLAQQLWQAQSVCTQSELLACIRFACILHKDPFLDFVDARSLEAAMKKLRFSRREALSVSGLLFAFQEIYTATATWSVAEVLMWVEKAEQLYGQGSFRQMVVPILQLMAIGYEEVESKIAQIVHVEVEYAYRRKLLQQVSGKHLASFCPELRGKVVGIVLAHMRFCLLQGTWQDLGELNLAQNSSLKEWFLYIETLSPVC